MTRPGKSLRRKRESRSGSSAPEADAKTIRPRRRSAFEEIQRQSLLKARDCRHSATRAVAASSNFQSPSPPDWVPPDHGYNSHLRFFVGKFFSSSSYLSRSLADRWGTTVDFTTSFLAVLGKLLKRKAFFGPEGQALIIITCQR